MTGDHLLIALAPWVIFAAALGIILFQVHRPRYPRTPPDNERGTS